MSHVTVEQMVDFLRLYVINMQRDFDGISTDEDKKELEEINILCGNFLKRKGWYK